MKNKKLGLLCPNPTDATSFYRGVKPFRRLAATSELPFELVDQHERFHWGVLEGLDGLVMQRPYKPEHVEIGKMAKRSGVPVWIDYDDDLFNVPTDNPAHAVYAPEETRKRMAELVRLADVVSVSTPSIEQTIRKFSPEKRIEVIPNALCERLIHMRKPERRMTRAHVFWRGSPTHQRDLMSHAYHFAEIPKLPVAENWVFTFLGYTPWFITDYIPPKSVITSPHLETLDYFETLPIVSPSIVIVPLAKNTFNRGKSNIAWIEATYAGAVCIAPDWDEWKKPGVINYTDEDDFGVKLVETMARFNDPKHRKELVCQNDESWKYIRENLLLSKVNAKRERLVEDLLFWGSNKRRDSQ